MKTIVVYYSLEGNTAYAAEKIAAALGADMLRLKPKKAYPSSGFQKFFWGGKSAVMAEKPKLVPYSFDGALYERIVFGFPVWAGNVTPPLRTFIRDENLAGKRFAAFACESGSGAEKAFGKLKAALGIDAFDAELVLIDPKSRPDPANGEKIRAFCDAGDTKCYAENALNELDGAAGIRALDVGERLCAEVDDPEDLARVRERISGK